MNTKELIEDMDTKPYDPNAWANKIWDCIERGEDIKRDCWIWTKGTQDGSPYYNIPRGSVKGARKQSAVQVLYFLKTGEKLPREYILARTCNNSLCVNLEHREVIKRSEYAKRPRADRWHKTVQKVQ